MAKSRSSTARTGRRSPAPGGAGTPKAARPPRGTATRPGLRAGEIPDDIELLNIHRYPESMPASLVAFVRNDRACQRRLEELVKTVPGKRGQSGFNQLFQQKLDETGSPAVPAAPAGESALAGSHRVERNVPVAGPSDRGAPAERPGAPAPGEGGVSGFLRKLFS